MIFMLILFYFSLVDDSRDFIQKTHENRMPWQVAYHA